MRDFGGLFFLFTSRVRESNQWEMSNPAASIIGLRRTSPRKRLPMEYLSHTSELPPMTHHYALRRVWRDRRHDRERTPRCPMRCYERRLRWECRNAAEICSSLSSCSLVWIKVLCKKNGDFCFAPLSFLTSKVGSCLATVREN